MFVHHASTSHYSAQSHVVEAMSMIDPTVTTESYPTKARQSFSQQQNDNTITIETIRISTTRPNVKMASASDNNDHLVQSSDPNHPANMIPELCKKFWHLGWVTGTGGGASIRQEYVAIQSIRCIL